MDEILDGHVLGKVTGNVGRGVSEVWLALPYAHILLILDGESCLMTATDYDNFSCPDPVTHPRLLQPTWSTVCDTRCIHDGGLNTKVAHVSYLGPLQRYFHYLAPFARQAHLDPEALPHKTFALAPTVSATAPVVHVSYDHMSLLRAIIEPARLDSPAVRDAWDPVMADVLNGASYSAATMKPVTLEQQRRVIEALFEVLPEGGRLRWPKQRPGAPLHITGYSLATDGYSVHVTAHLWNATTMVPGQGGAEGGCGGQSDGIRAPHGDA